MSKVLNAPEPAAQLARAWLATSEITPENDERVLGLDFLGSGLIRANLDGELLDVDAAQQFRDEPNPDGGRTVTVIGPDGKELWSVTVAAVFYRRFLLAYPEVESAEELDGQETLVLE